MTTSLKTLSAAAALMACCWTGAVTASEGIDLESFSLEELLNVEVVSVSKKAESAVRAPAAVFIITAEDIRRSGATCVPEALRLAPGVHAARIDATRWALTVRGFNGRYANKLQVLVDGRSVYSPMFSGTYWEAGEVLLEDIEQIEVIRGPGATLWGANAVNGVINIITRRVDADDRVAVGAWTGGQGLYRTRASISENTGENGALRLSAAGTKRGSTVTTTGTDSGDDADEFLVTGRWDQDYGEHDRLTVSGRMLGLDQRLAYDATAPTPPFSTFGNDEATVRIAGIEATWHRDLSPASGLEISASRMWFRRDEFLLSDHHEIADLNLQHNFAPIDRHEVIWGAGYRHYQDDMRGSLGYGFEPSSQTDWTLHAFVQDEFTAVRDRLELTLGAKIEKRNYIDTRWQPSGRFAWTPGDRHTVWGSVASAIRTPSRSDRHLFIDIAAIPPGATPMNPDNTIMLSLLGDDGVTPEELIAYETGYRLQPADHLLLDFAYFFNEYENLISSQAGGIRPHPIYGLPVMQMPLIRTNSNGGHTEGGELAATMDGERARLRLTYSYITNEKHSPGEDESAGFQELNTPHHQYSAHLGLNPGAGLEVDLLYRHLQSFKIDEVAIPAQDELDLRLGLMTGNRWRLSLGGRNLLHENHLEFYDNSGSPFRSLVERTYVATAEWRF